MSPLAGLKNLRWVLLLPRLRRGLNDCARFAGFQATTDFRLTLMGLSPWATIFRPYRGWCDLHHESLGQDTSLPGSPGAQNGIWLAFFRWLPRPCAGSPALR